MPPITPRAARTRVARTRAARSTRRLHRPKKVWSSTDHEVYFLWLHLQLKDGEKPNHAAVAAKLNITKREAVHRLTQLKEQMEQMENTVEPLSPRKPPMTPEAQEKKKARFDFKNDPIDKAFEEMDIVFRKYSTSELR